MSEKKGTEGKIKAEMPDNDAPKKDFGLSG